MSLPIKTFSNKEGPDCLFKALGHPLVPTLAAGFLEDLRAAREVAVYDPFDVLDTFADSSKLAQNLGYQPSTPVKEGVKQFVEWYLNDFPSLDQSYKSEI